MVRKQIKKVFILLLTGVAGIACEQQKPPANFSSIEGIFKCQESSVHAGARNYLVEIDKVKDEEGLFIISNFHNAGENEFLYAELDADTLRIFNQVISSLTVNGKGPVGSDFRSISLFYITDDGTTVLDYFAGLTR